MLINGILDLVRPQAVQPSGAASETAAASAPGQVRGEDPISFSPQASDIARYHRQLAALPDIRPDRVALAKQQVQQGGYRVDANLLAQKILGGAGA